MLRTLNVKLIRLKAKANRFLWELQEEERGDSNFVSVLMLILVVIAVAAVFNKGLTGVVSKFFDTLKLDLE